MTFSEPMIEIKRGIKPPTAPILITAPVVKCNFYKAWIGKCRNKADESGYCEEHKGLKCCSCGDQATHDCEETMQLVCGCLLCANCEHELSPNGTNGGTFRHCRKDEQIYDYEGRINPEAQKKRLRRLRKGKLDKLFENESL